MVLTDIENNDIFIPVLFIVLLFAVYVFLTVCTDGGESDDEDYSASVNAIMQRRASTKKARRRNSRRGSSPFSPDILMGSETGRRRSSVYTTSSGE